LGQHVVVVVMGGRGITKNKIKKVAPLLIYACSRVRLL
jgi:hypothetical protein